MYDTGTELSMHWVDPWLDWAGSSPSKFLVFDTRPYEEKIPFNSVFK